MRKNTHLIKETPPVSAGEESKQSKRMSVNISKMTKNFPSPITPSPFKFDNASNGTPSPLKISRNVPRETNEYLDIVR